MRCQAVSPSQFKSIKADMDYCFITTAMNSVLLVRGIIALNITRNRGELAEPVPASV